MGYQEEFINEITPYVTKYAKLYGYKYPSAIIAQACWETGYGRGSSGKGDILAQHNNFFGMKTGSNWSGGSINVRTHEEYSPGTLTAINDNFRTYSSIDEGVKGYFEFISSGRYSNLKSSQSSMDYLTKLKADGYATASSYASSVYGLVKTYGLTRYDTGQQVGTTGTESFGGTTVASDGTVVSGAGASVPEYTADDWQPDGAYYAFISVKCGEVTFTDTNHMMSIDSIRVSGNIGTSFVIEVYDDTGYEIEQALLSSGSREIEYWYGYAGGSESDHYKGLVMDISPSFSGTGMMISIEGIPTGSYDSATNAEAKVYEGDTNSDIVQQVADEEGWNLKVNTPTEKTYPNASTKSNKDDTKIKKYRADGQSAEDFINTQVAPTSRSTDGKTGYQVVLNQTADGTDAYFTTPGETGDAGAYVYYIGKESDDVIEFTPHYEKMLTAMFGSAGIETGSVDSLTGDGTGAAGGTGSGVTKDIDTGATTSVKKGVTSSDTEQNTEIQTQGILDSLSSQVYSATLVIKGRPNLLPFQKIHMYVYTKDGKLHHSSGDYCIQSVEDTIDGGVFTTTLELLKNSMTDTGMTSFSSGVVDSQTVTYSQGEELGEFTITGYTADYQDEAGNVKKTAGGNVPSQGKTVCSNGKSIKIGTTIIIDGAIYTVDDKNSKLGDKELQIYFKNSSDAKAYGSKTKKVYKANKNIAGSSNAGVPTGVPDTIYSRTAAKYLGIPYLWGGKSPSTGMDCSGFTTQVYKDLGVDIGHGTGTQQNKGTNVPISGNPYGCQYAVPGDLLFYGNPIHHVTLYLGNGYEAQEPKTGDVCKISRLYRTPSRIRRIML